MAVDILNQLAAKATVTATTNGTGLDLVVGTPRRGLKARIIYTAAANASGSNTVTWSIDSSTDNTTFTTLSTGESVVTLTSTAQAGEVYIPFETSSRYVRASATVAGTGTSPSIVYQCDLSASRPG